MLLEYLLPVDVGIDGLLFREALVEAHAVNLGRMSIATSLSLGFGLAILTLDAELPHGQRPAEYLVLIVMLVGLRLRGAGVVVDAVFDTFPFAAMPLPARCCSWRSASASSHARPDRGLLAVVTSDHVGGVMARWLLPGPVILLPIAIAWPRLQGERLGWYGASWVRISPP